MTDIRIDPQELTDTATMMRCIAECLRDVCAELPRAAACCCAPRAIALQVEAGCRNVGSHLGALVDTFDQSANDLTRRGAIASNDLADDDPFTAWPLTGDTDATTIPDPFPVVGSTDEWLRSMPTPTPATTAIPTSPVTPATVGTSSGPGSTGLTNGILNGSIFGGGSGPIGLDAAPRHVDGMPDPEGINAITAGLGTFGGTI